jgi:hypothetical protein
LGHSHGGAPLQGVGSKVGWEELVFLWFLWFFLGETKVFSFDLVFFLRKTKGFPLIWCFLGGTPRDFRLISEEN